MAVIAKKNIPSALYIVATPIGNLTDITIRALDILRYVDIIAAEDTRQTKKLLTHYQITGKKLISFYDAIEKSRTEVLIAAIKNQGHAVALVSDAGTPGIADPGCFLVAKAHEQKIPVIPIPGCSSVASIVSVSGLVGSKFTFVGFVPKKNSDMLKAVHSWATLPGAIVFFTTSRQIIDVCHLIKQEYPEATLCIGRELTKLFETLYFGPIDVVTSLLNTNCIGEFSVVLVTNKTMAQDDLFIADLTQRLLTEGLSFKSIAKVLQLKAHDKKLLYHKSKEK